MKDIITATLSYSSLTVRNAEWWHVINHKGQNKRSVTIRANQIPPQISTWLRYVIKAKMSGVWNEV